MADTMSSRERWLSALDFQPLDRLPFWAKLEASYARSQRAEHSGKSLAQLHSLAGSEPHGGVGPCIRRMRTTTSREVDEQPGERTTRFVGPSGTLTMVERFDDLSQSWHPVEFPLHTRQDVEMLTEWHLDERIELDETALEKARQQARNADTAVATSIGTSPVMDFLQHLAGIDHGHYLWADYPREVEALFDAMHRNLLRAAEIICETTPADIIYMVENTSTTLHSPDQFRADVLPRLREYATCAVANGKRMVLHMCGYLKALLPDLDTLPVAAFEAFTSPPVGNTTLLDGRSACPNKCLIGGTNAALWLRPAKEIIATLERDLDALPHHRGLVVSSSGVMPPATSPDTIRTVVDWLRTYPARW